MPAPRLSSAQRELEGIVADEVAELHGVAADSGDLEPERDLLSFADQVQLVGGGYHRRSHETAAVFVGCDAQQLHWRTVRDGRARLRGFMRGERCTLTCGNAISARGGRAEAE